MKKYLRILLLSGLVVAIGGYFAYQYVYTTEHRDVAAEVATESQDAKALAALFVKEGTSANAKYLEKVVEVTGTITALEGKNYILDSVVNCVMTVEANVQKGQKVTIKGRVVGFDDFLGELKIDQCTLKK